MLQMGSESRNLVLQDISRRLAEAESFEEIKSLREKAEAVRAYARSARLGLQVQNRAAELKLRAERKAGELLTSLKLRGGDRKSNVHRDRLKLEDLGITQNQSKRWQREASVPDEAFEEYVEHANRIGAEISSASLMRISHRRDPPSQAQTTSQTPSPHFGRRLANDLLDTIADLKGHRDALANVVDSTGSKETGALREESTVRLMDRYLAEMGKSVARLEELLSGILRACPL